MGCTHERIKSVNCILYCDICGEKLPADYLTGKHSTKPAQAAETPEKGEKTKPTRKRKAAQ